MSNPDTAPVTYGSLFAIKGFAPLWLGESSARLGFQLSNFLVPLVALTVLHESGTRVGLISMAQFIPVAAFALIAGALAGRIALRTLLILTNLVRSVAMALLGALYATVGLEFVHLIIAAFLIGTATVFYDVAYQAFVPRLVRATLIAPANGLLQATNSVSQLAGPAVAGFLLEQLGLAAAIGAAWALFGSALLNFATLHSIPARHVEVKPLLRTIRRGVQHVWHSRPIRDLCAQAGTFNLFEQAFLTAFTVYAVKTLGLSGGVVGLVIGTGSAGALLGSLIAPKITRVRVGVIVTSALPCAAAAFLLVPLFTTFFGGALAPLLIALVLNGVALSFFNVYAVSLRQTIPPEQHLESTTASYRLVSRGTVPIGALFGGVAVDALGGNIALWLIAVSATLASLAFQKSPLRKISAVATARHDTTAAAD